MSEWRVASESRSDLLADSSANPSISIAGLFGGPEPGGGFAEVVDETGASFFAGLVVGGAEDRGGVDGGEDGRESWRVQDFAAFLGDAELVPEE